MSASDQLRSVQFGHFHDSIPLPHEPEATSLFPAGEFTLGLEYRVFDPAFERTRLTPEEVAAAGEDSLFHRDEPDEGVCVHVFLSEMREVLRFDCFGAEPHYHYIVPEEGNVLVHYDPVANGPMFDWTIEALRDRADSMLAAVTGGAPQLDASAWRAALDQLVAKAGELGITSG